MGNEDRSRVHRGWAAAVPLLLMASPLWGQPFLLKDVRTLPRRVSSDPTSLFSAGGKLYFAATQVHVGTELWVSDGTGLGTLLLRDIEPGAASSSPGSFITANGLVYFIAKHGQSSELWRTDGTVGGTVPVYRLSDIDSLAEAGGTIYFRGWDQAAGGELWKSDGTTAGTSLVRDIWPGPGQGLAGPLVDVNGTLFFGADDSVAGVELWRSDGTAAGTVMVRDIQPGNTGSSPSALVASSGALYFAASAGTGEELWKSDGTAGGTTLVADLDPTGSSAPRELVAVGGVVYFTADDGTNGRELWVSGASGTTMVADIRPGSSGSSPLGLTAVGGVIYMAANDGAAGVELWRSDGTAAGTFLLLDSVSGSTGSYPLALAAAGGSLYYTADDPSFGRELFRSDGTPGGTGRVKDIYPGSSSSRPSQIVDLNGRAYFDADEAAAGVELWTSDGTSGGTLLVRDLASGFDSYAAGFTSFAGGAYFNAFDDTDVRSFWRTDGTTAGTAVFWPGSTSVWAVMDGVLYFFSNASELWRTDGTVAGTDFIYYVNGTTPVSVDGVLYFPGLGTSGSGWWDQLWRTDGTTGGTFIVADLYAGPGTGDIRDVVTMNGDVYFTALDGSNGRELWRSDGTAAGTAMVRDIHPSGSGVEGPLVVMNGVLYFPGGAPTSRGLWRSDGTLAGTWLVRGGIVVKEVASAGGALVFGAVVAGVGHELWKSDGTTGGTVLVKDISPGAASSQPSGFTDLGPYVCFAAHVPASGWELWRSDGTAAGTIPVKDIIPGPDGYRITELVPANGALYFAAYDVDHGVELWTSRGDVASTVRVADINPGPSGSSPGAFRQVGPLLYFNATEETTGNEPHALWVGCPSIVLAPPSLPLAAQGAPYTATLAASGGVAPYGYAVTAGALPAGLVLSPGGVLSGTPTALGTYAFDVTATDAVGCEGTSSYVVTVAPVGSYVLGEGLGSTPANTNRVRVHRADGTFAGVDFQAYGAGQWGTNVAAASIDGAAHAEIVTGPGPGAVFGPHVRAFDRSGTAIAKVSFYAYGSLRYGANVGTGGLDADGPAEILTGAGPGTIFGPHVRAFNFDGAAISAIAKINYFAYGTLQYGVNVASGDLDRDGFAEILTGPGPGTAFAATVRGWNYDGSSVAPMGKVAYDAFTYRHGVNVAGGDADGDGFAEIASAPGPGPTNPSRLVGHDFDGAAIAALPGFDVTPWSGTLFGARGGLADVGTDGSSDLLAGRGRDPAADSEVRGYRYAGSSLTLLGGTPFLPFTGAGYGYGVNVAGGALGQ